MELSLTGDAAPLRPEDRPLDRLKTFRPPTAVAAMTAFALAAAASRFVSAQSYQGSLADDFYYYLAIAESMANGQGSTFFGAETNGYHPLWMLVLAMVVRLFGSGFVGFAVISLIIAGLLVACFAVLTKAGICLGFRRSVASASALLAGAVALPLAHLGLETALVLLGLSGALWWISLLIRGPIAPRHYLLGGLATSACVLARLDSVVVLAGLFAAALHHLSGTRVRQEALPGFPMFAAGLLPVIAYAGTNLVFFHSLLPASAEAKSLVPGTFPSFRVVRDLSTQVTASPSVLGTAAGLSLLLGLITVRSQRRQWPGPAVSVLAGLIMSTGAYYLTLSWQSSWPVHAWYAYPFVLTVFLLTALILNGLPRLEALAVVAAVVLVVAFLASLELFPNSSARRADALGQEIEVWAASHPGSFAMGDLAGNTAWRLQRPFVQLEGLVMPSDFGKHIRDGEPLHTLLRRYGITYYATISAQEDGSCYRFREPALASPGLTGMTARFCGDPQTMGDARGVKYYVFAVNEDGWQ